MGPGSYFKQVFNTSYYYIRLKLDSYIGINSFNQIVFESFIKGYSNNIVVFNPSSLRIDQIKILLDICNAKW